MNLVRARPTFKSDKLPWWPEQDRGLLDPGLMHPVCHESDHHHGQSPVARCLVLDPNSRVYVRGTEEHVV